VLHIILLKQGIIYMEYCATRVAEDILDPLVLSKIMPGYGQVTRPKTEKRRNYLFSLDRSRKLAGNALF